MSVEQSGMSARPLGGVERFSRTDKPSFCIHLKPPIMKSFNFILKSLKLSPNHTLQYLSMVLYIVTYAQIFYTNPTFGGLQGPLLDPIIYHKDSCYLLKSYSVSFREINKGKHFRPYQIRPTTHNVLLAILSCGVRDTHF